MNFGFAVCPQLTNCETFFGVRLYNTAYLISHAASARSLDDNNRQSNPFINGASQRKGGFATPGLRQAVDNGFPNLWRQQNSPAQAGSLVRIEGCVVEMRHVLTGV